MKNAKIIVGLITTTLLLLGYLFKVNYWPGGIYFLLIGFNLLIIGYLPIIFIDRFQKTDNQLKKASIMTGLAASIVLFVGVLFKQLHWPGGYHFLIFGMISFIAIAFPMHAIACYREDKSEIKDFMFITIIIIAVVSIITPDRSPNAYIKFNFDIGSKLHDLQLNNHARNKDILSLYITKNGNDTLIEKARVLNNKIEELKKDLIIACEGPNSMALENAEYLEFPDEYISRKLFKENPSIMMDLNQDIQNFETMYNDLINKNTFPKSFQHKFQTAPTPDDFWDLETLLSYNPISINLMTLSLLQIDILESMNLYILKVNTCQ